MGFQNLVVVASKALLIIVRERFFCQGFFPMNYHQFIRGLGLVIQRFGDMILDLGCLFLYQFVYFLEDMEAFINRLLYELYFEFLRLIPTWIPNRYS